MKVILTEDEAINGLYAFMGAKLDTGIEPARLEISIEREEVANEELVSMKRLKDTVQHWARSGGIRNKIEMIKDVRYLTGWGLRQSKDFVEDNSIPF